MGLKVRRGCRARMLDVKGCVSSESQRVHASLHPNYCRRFSCRGCECGDSTYCRGVALAAVRYLVCTRLMGKKPHLKKVEYRIHIMKNVITLAVGGGAR